MSEDRISRLGERFRTHGVGRPRTSKRSRERRSFYLDGDLVDRLDQTYRDISHEMYPAEVNKSEFLETLIEYGLENLPDLKETLSAAKGQGA